MRTKAINNGPHLAYARRGVAAATLCAFLFMGGCATAWHTQGSFYRTAQTQLRVESDPPGKVYIDNRYVGPTPVEVPLEYGQEVERKTRAVSYWDSQPGWSLLLTLASLGLYLPFSLIPVDVDTALEPHESYKDNLFRIAVDAEGYQQWKQEVVANGEKTIHLQPLLEKTAEE